MDAELRAHFNGAWSAELAHRVRSDLDRRLGCEIPFPVAETPVFFPAYLRERLETAGNELVDLLSDPKWIKDHESIVPSQYRCPGRGHLPHVAQFDFAITRDEEGLFAPRLVELQGFPSLYGFQIQLADVWATHLAAMAGMPDRWRLFFSGHDRYSGRALLQHTLVGNHDPEEVILLDLDPFNQKTYPDFAVTQRWWGIDPVCPTDLKRDGNKLFRVKDGRTIPVRRFYHRVVIDELEKSGVELPFRFDEDLDVEWIPHPEWWFIWSKHSMLTLDHPAAPKTKLLSEIDELPEHLDNYVVKPLYSFAGAGVNVGPTIQDMHSVPMDQRAQWVLQEKIDYTPAFESVNGDPVKIEVRVMFARPEGEEKMTMLLNLIRLSRGKMMGVDFNHNLDWTGASVGIWT